MLINFRGMIGAAVWARFGRTSLLSSVARGSKRGSFQLVAMATLALAGCVSTKYQLAPDSTPPAVRLELAAVQAPLEFALRSLVIYQGPGSWKREALWDEYVVTIRNPGPVPVTVDAAGLLDDAGLRLEPGADPWLLEKTSLADERRYRRAGVAFVRAAAPGTVIVAAGTAAVASAGVLTAAAGSAAVATLVALPLYYGVVLAMDHANKQQVVEEFAKRRLALPATLQPGESRSGSLFFPMVPNPRSLSLEWTGGTAHGTVTLTLESLRGLHTG